jgi:hypothetical protein
MAESFIPTPVVTGPIGKKLKAFETVDGGGNVVESEAVTLTDGTTGAEVHIATEPTQELVLDNLVALNSLVPTRYDYIALGYTGQNATEVVYKLGGALGVVVSTLALVYDGSNNLVSVTKT